MTKIKRLKCDILQCVWDLIGFESTTTLTAGGSEGCQTCREAPAVPWWSVAALPRRSAGPGSSCRWFPPAGRSASYPGFCCPGHCLWCVRMQSVSVRRNRAWVRVAQSVFISQSSLVLFKRHFVRCNAQTPLPVCDWAFVLRCVCVSLWFNPRALVCLFCLVMSTWEPEIQGSFFCVCTIFKSPNKEGLWQFSNALPWSGDIYKIEIKKNCLTYSDFQCHVEYRVKSAKNWSHLQCSSLDLYCNP